MCWSTIAGRVVHECCQILHHILHTKDKSKEIQTNPVHPIQHIPTYTTLGLYSLQQEVAFETMTMVLSKGHIPWSFDRPVFHSVFRSHLNFHLDLTRIKPATRTNKHGIHNLYFGLFSYGGLVLSILLDITALWLVWAFTLHIQSCLSSTNTGAQQRPWQADWSLDMIPTPVAMMGETWRQLKAHCGWQNPGCGWEESA